LDRPENTLTQLENKRRALEGLRSLIDEDIDPNVLVGHPGVEEKYKEVKNKIKRIEKVQEIEKLIKLTSNEEEVRRRLGT